VSFGTTAPIGDLTVRTVTIRNTTIATAQTTGPLVFTLSNTAEFTVTDSAVSGCATARVSGLAGNTTCNVDVTLTPLSAKTIADSLTVTAAPGGTVVIPLNGTSVSAITVTPPTHTFAMNGMQVYTVTLAGATNPTPSGNLTVALSGANAASFMKSADTCTGASLHTGALTCTVTIVYTGSGAATATLTVAGTTPGDTTSATLTGS